MLWFVFTDSLRARARYIMGLLFILLVVFLWVGSGTLIQVHTSCYSIDIGSNGLRL